MRPARTRRSDMTSAFDGVRVLELGQIYNGPYCGLLAQLGADVIKIEHPAANNCGTGRNSPPSPTSSSCSTRTSAVWCST